MAPFHQWTPDVYEGAPTPVTAFMATATKAAALGVLLRFFDVAAIHLQSTWAPALATLAAITIIVGNVGALGQSSLKRMLGYSSVAQAGYMLSGVIVATELGIDATVLYLGLYMFMNLAAFAVIIAVQRERADGDELSGLAGLGRRDPWLAWPMTIAMLALAGIPGTVGFIGKFQLIHALVNGGYTWLAIVLVIGSMISLAYYLRVIASLWMRDEVPAPAPGIRGALAGRGGLAPIAGGSPEADAGEGAFATAPRASGMAGVASRAGGHRGGGAVRRRHRGLRDLPVGPVQPRRPCRAGAGSDLARRVGVGVGGRIARRRVSLPVRPRPAHPAHALHGPEADGLIDRGGVVVGVGDDDQPVGAVGGHGVAGGVDEQPRADAAPAVADGGVDRLVARRGRR